MSFKPADFTPWAPLAPLPAPSALAQAQMPALVSFWNRVRADVMAVHPASEERLARHAAGASTLSEDIRTVMAKPLSVATLQELHVLATRDQTAARVVVSDGSYRYVAFPYGKIKDKPNHLSSGGRISREFAPPERVMDELAALFAEHDRIPASMPDVRAAWLVIGFLQVHPFVDGNGRVSRLLASWDFLRAGLPPVWNEATERGTGWDDALDEAVATGDLTPVTRLLATHQERLVTRLLLLAEAVPPDATLDDAIVHRDTLIQLRARSQAHAASMRALLPTLTETVRAALQALAARLGGDLEVVAQIGRAEKCWRQANEAGVTADRREPGALISLRSRAPKTVIQVGLVALGTSGSGAWTAFVRVRPRSTFAVSVPALTLLPEEGDASVQARFDRWLERALTDAVGSWVRIA